MARRSSSSEVTEALIYCRVSKEDGSGLGLEAQESRCRAWATANGYAVAGVYIDDGLSARTLDRPALKRAISELHSSRVLVAHKLDRITRTVSDFPALAAWIDSVGSNWATVEERFDTGSACGRLMLHMILTVSQHEREQTAERTQAALAAKRARGERLGASPLGYRTAADGTVTEVADEIATVQQARDLRAQGRTLREIALILERDGHSTKRGGRWAASTVRNLISPRYVERMHL